MNEFLKQPCVPEGKEGKKKRILVADDMAQIREVIKDILVDEDREIFEVSSGQELLDELKRNKYDLVITDNSMPVKNEAKSLTGIDVLKTMREDVRFKDVPVIVISADLLANPELENMVKGLNASGLSKPFNLKSLIETVKKELKEE